jgi:hypothetical protein
MGGRQKQFFDMTMKAIELLILHIGLKTIIFGNTICDVARKTCYSKLIRNK